MPGHALSAAFCSAGRLARVAAFATLVAHAAVAAVAAGEVRTVRVRFEPGSDHAAVKGHVSGGDSVLYKVNARSGQFLSLSLSSASGSVGCNLYIPGRGPGDEALHISEAGGRDYVGQLYKDGDHTVSVFLNRNAARQGKEADFELNFRITAEPPGPVAPVDAGIGFRKEVAYGKLKFTVSSPADGGRFTIQPAGLTVRNEPITREVVGRVVDVIIDDIDGDNWPEVAVISGEAEGRRRSAEVFSTYAGKSFGPVNFPPVADTKLLTGYAGGDEFAFVENTFIRRFPLDEGGEKSGKTRQLQFKLEAGEAGKQLRLDRSVDY